jgi:hypothetical protein
MTRAFLEENKMKSLSLALTILFLSPSFNAFSQSPEPSRTSVMKNWDVWVGDWTLVGTAKDGPSTAEYKVTWKLHEARIFGGAFIQVDQIWQGSGPEERALGILSYDPVKKLPSSYGFYSDGSTWIASATFSDLNCIETGTTITSDGKYLKWRVDWTFSKDRMSVSGSQEIEHDGVKWTAFTVKGTKVPDAMTKH